jgi:hypothetical protein
MGAARQAMKNMKFPSGGGGGVFGGTAALLGLGGLAWGVNASLYNGN